MITITHIGGPTAALRIGGLTLLTDPAFDQPGEYPIPGRVMRKLTAPAVAVEDLGRVDAVLLSHDQHWDNLDRAGRALLPTVGTVLSTPDAAGRLDGVTGLDTWSTYDLVRPDGGILTVTGLPARHGPEGCEPLLGAVTGFLLSGDGLPTVYVSGDNASVELVGQIADRLGPVDVAVLFAGAARAPQLVDGPLTLTVDAAVDAARLLAPAAIVPVHQEGWAHFTQGPAELSAGFTAAGLADRLHTPVAGVELGFEPLPATRRTAGR